MVVCCIFLIKFFHHSNPSNTIFLQGVPKIDEGADENGDDGGDECDDQGGDESGDEGGYEGGDECGNEANDEGSESLL